jgi:SpoVK/Ycf46/Vps4 family AAA+-type ATPase
MKSLNIFVKEKRMRKRNRRISLLFHNKKQNNNYSLAQHWSFQILIHMGIWSKISDPFIEDNIIDFLDIKDLCKEDIDLSEKQFYQELKQKSDDLQKQDHEPAPLLVNNLKNLAIVLNLNRTEVKILTFAVILHTNRVFKEIVDKLGELSVNEVFEVLSFLLDAPLEETRLSLNTNNTLFRSGLLQLNSFIFNDLSSRLELMDGFADTLLTPDIDTDEIFKSYFYPVSQSQLTLDDFDYLADQILLIKRLLSHVRKTSVKGFNILLHGPPGTGKSELARTIAMNCGFKLHEIAMNNDVGDPVEGQERFSAFRLAQQVLKRHNNNLIVFDEIEDVFPQTMMSLFHMSSNDKGQKAWVNRLLESNEVPSIWISNAVDQIDEAYKRRFKLVVKMGIPPQKARLNILKRSMKSLPVSNDWLEILAENDDLSPALVTQAAEMVTMINSNGTTASKLKKPLTESDTDAIEADFTRILNNSLEVMEKKKISHQTSSMTMAYNVNALNPDRNIKELVIGLNRHRQGRICLYGPPGTGKTAFGHYIASQLEKKLLVKRASDILSMYVGGTEENIARMFEQSTLDGSVLLLDEADSFLRDRNGANQSWEVTQVNELLTQMEDYEGIFICSTNLMDNLDAASIRRFDLKIKLDYLQQDQAWTLFRQVVKEQGSRLTRHAWCKQQLSHFNNLTPGDFATVVRQNRLSSKKLAPALLLEGLMKESEFKTGKKRGIGFAADF